MAPVNFARKSTHSAPGVPPTAAKVWLFVGHHFAQVTEGLPFDHSCDRSWSQDSQEGSEEVLRITLLLWNSLPPSTSKEFEGGRFCL